MENVKINVAKLLENCPSGMELDCTMFNDVVFNTVEFGKTIIVTRTNGTDIHLDKYGTFSNGKDAQCVIFPKGKTTWEGFVPPCKFKDGDIITCNNRVCTFISIFKERPTEKSFREHCSVILDNNKFIVGITYADYVNPRFATEEEKIKLFQAIKDNGYKWNEETKTLEKLPKFKVGNKIKLKGGDEFGFITQVTDCFYTIKSKNHTHYWSIKKQDDWELVLDKFDINTLVPFESRVLMRSSNAREWTGTIFSHYSNNKFYGCGMCCDQCIPYEGNEHLLGKCNDCNEYFKTWV